MSDFNRLTSVAVTAHASRLLFSILMIVATLMANAGRAIAQQQVITTADGQQVIIQGGQPVMSAQPAAAVQTGAAKAGEESKPADGAAKPDKNKAKEGDAEGKKDENKADEKPSVIKRPMLDKDAIEPIETQVSLDENLKVSFSLKGQSWERVLQWIADVSRLSLDWQELPGDTLNITTTRSYSLPEARDLLNRHLLSRGYSMVLDGEMLSVLKLSDVKPSLVPRVNSQQLQTMLDHTLCKMSFDLQWLIADETVEEITPLLSKAGKISKMSRTNRLEIMDTAGSLKDIYNILQEEQSDSGQEQLVKTFPLKHRRATEVIVLIRDLLGVDPPPGGGGGGRSSGDMGQVTSVMRQMTQQLQRMAQNSGGSKSGGAREPTKTRLVLNQRENMILAQAMPDQMAIIEKAIGQIDVPVEPSNSLLQNLSRMKVYRLETVDPQMLVDLLQELGDMSPGTVLKADKSEKSIMAFATLADHLTITSLVERMDESGRDVEVIHLRRLDAEYVAGTIMALMGPKEEESNSRSSYYRYSYQQEEKTDERDFKIEADIENNRLLVYANKIEMNEIMLLLQKLGEIPDPDAANSGMRVFDLGPGDDPRELLQRLQKVWQGKNKLEINLPEPKEEPEDDQNAEQDRSSDKVTNLERPLSADEFFAMLEDRPAVPATSIRRNSRRHRGSAERTPKVAPQQFLTASRDNIRDEDVDEERQEGSSGTAPVRFGITADGRLLVTSDDKEALNEIEELLREMVRPLPNYKIFYMKYATPSWVTLNLKDYFESEEDSGSGLRYDPYWGGFLSTNKKSGKASLGRRKQPRFITDNFTSTILVRNADRRQLQVIEDLIAIYDVPEPSDTRAMRVTRIFKLKNSKAEIVAQAVKDVFRDLLSANDKALEKKDGEKPKAQVYSYFGGADTSSDDDDAPIRFKGLLSIGVDGLSNTLVISSTGSLMDIIGELVESLDEAAESSSTVRVLQVDSSVDLKLIQERLNKSLGIKSQTQSPGKKGQGQQNPNQPAGQQVNPQQ